MFARPKSALNAARERAPAQTAALNATMTSFARVHQASVGNQAALRSLRMRPQPGGHLTAPANTPLTVDSGSEAPSIVHQVLRMPGQPLDPTTRRFMEPRLGHDLSSVRIHADALSATSAAAVSAKAYTVGNEIVFGTGRYQPQSTEGLHLLVHEVAHTLQQSPVLSRQPVAPATPCLGGDVCQAATPSDVLNSIKKTEGNTRERREAACRKTPPDPACTADGHGDRAVELEAVVRAFDPDLLNSAEGIFIDRDLKNPAMTVRCANFMPPIPVSSGHLDCITVPKQLEDDARQFNGAVTPDATFADPQMEKGKEAIGRDEWRNRTLELFVHEAAHTRFRQQLPLVRTGQPPQIFGTVRPGCTLVDAEQAEVFWALNELHSMLQELPLRQHRLKNVVGLSAEDRNAEMEAWRDHRMRNTNPGSQTIPNALKTVRCRCACADSEALINETIDKATQSWAPEDIMALDSEMLRLEYTVQDLRWPHGGLPVAPEQKPQNEATA